MVLSSSTMEEVHDCKYRNNYKYLNYLCNLNGTVICVIDSKQISIFILPKNKYVLALNEV